MIVFIKNEGKYPPKSIDENPVLYKSPFSSHTFYALKYNILTYSLVTGISSLSIDLAKSIHFLGSICMKSD
jgi:hypothetical protein